MLTDVVLRQRLGDQLIRFRGHTGVTRIELAEEIAVSVSAIGSYERGERWPDAPVLARLIDHHVVNVRELFATNERSIA